MKTRKGEREERKSRNRSNLQLPMAGSDPNGTVVRAIRLRRPPLVVVQALLSVQYLVALPLREGRFPPYDSAIRVRESAGESRQGVADERAVWRRSSEPLQPRVMRRLW